MEHSLNTAPLRDGLGMVVNFFLGSSEAETRGLIVSTTETGLRLLTLSPTVDAVLLVDGSPTPCNRIRAICAALGVLYHHADRCLTYVEAYNIGWRRLPYRYIGLMANDILPNPVHTIDTLLKWVKKPNVGCTFPYMLSSRHPWDEVQRPGFTDRGTVTCEPTTMTLNLNLFKRSILENLGGLEELYTAGYQEPILIIKIRTLGYRVVLVGNTGILHLDALTKSLGQSRIVDDSFERDKQRWFIEYPAYASARGLANIRTWIWPQATTLRVGLVWFLTALVPFRRLRFRLIESVLWIEPWLCRFPTRRRNTGAA